MDNLEKLFVTYELALKLKEKGFNEECLAAFIDGKLNLPNSLFFKIAAPSGVVSVDTLTNGTIAAPMYSQVIDWFRTEKDIDISILPVFRDKCGYDSFKRDGYTYNILKIDPCQFLSWSDFNQCAEDRDEEIKDEGKLTCLIPSYKDYRDVEIKAIEDALTLIKHNG